LHIDVGSSLYFCSLVSAFVPVRFYDYRKAELNLSGLDSRQGDLNRLPLQDRSAESVSCMHVIEHVGLGRYGDPLDPEGDLKAIRELKRVVAPAGTLLIVVPVGRPRILFNAHRIYSYPEMMKNFEEFELKEFALIPDHATDGDLLVNPDPGMVDRQDYACGCFQFVRASQ
jgi:SAM-dependent methyltransferase